MIATIWMTSQGVMMDSFGSQRDNNGRNRFRYYCRTDLL